MMRPLIAAALAACLALPAAAQTRQCAPRADVLRVLTETYGEARIGMGVSSDGQAVVEMFAAEAGNWTMTVTTADGLTCLIAAGEGWGPGALPRDRKPNG